MYKWCLLRNKSTNKSINLTVIQSGLVYLSRAASYLKRYM